MKVIYIASLGRSGSTVLDLKLSSLDRVISCGEVWRVIKPHGGGLESVRERKCTCGESGGSCGFWSTVFDRIETANAKTLPQCYRVFLEVVNEKYGDDVILVDSSKSVQSLAALLHVKDMADIYVVFTARDVRGWMYSISEAARRKRELPWGKIFQPDFKYFWLSYIRHNILRLIPLWLPHEWLLGNARLLYSIKNSRFPRLMISYEELVFRSDSTLERVGEFIGNGHSLSTQRDIKGEAHIIRGNRAAFSTDSRSPLIYDVGWMSRWVSSSSLTLLPWVWWMNKKWVYGRMGNKPRV